MATAKKKTPSKDGKSGLRKLKPGEVLFNDGEKADSLFIIQNGQLRLFKPKGKGFVEIAVLRAGEVIGEMAFFDDAGGGKRSCSASATVSSEVIEISFVAFGKTMEGLNPWFKTIINTLANRLRATNSRVKELESNSTSVDYGTGKHSGYEFLKTHDIIKVLGGLFLIFKAHGEEHPNGIAVHKKTLDMYIKDIFGVVEVKIDEILLILNEIGAITTLQDKDGLPNIYVTKSQDYIRDIFLFYNTERHLDESKKLRIELKTQMFLQELDKKLNSVTNIDGNCALVPVDDILAKFESEQLAITLEHLYDAREYGIVRDVIVGENNQKGVEVFLDKMQKFLPKIIFLNKVKETNRAKSKAA